MFRAGMWAVIVGFGGLVALWGKWSEVVEVRRRMQSEVPDQFRGDGRGVWEEDGEQKSFFDGLRRRW